MRTRIALLLLLVACEPPAPKHKPQKYVAHKRVVNLTMTVPDGYTAHYNAITDSWRFVSSANTVVFERTPEASALSPEALRQALHLDAQIESRPGLNDGFSTTFVAKDGKRTLYVVRQIYNHDWFRCVSPDPSDDVASLCKSLKRPRRN
jgi:hypothetical protein